jgi:hypothetical protein
MNGVRSVELRTTKEAKAIPVLTLVASRVRRCA